MDQAFSIAAEHPPKAGLTISTPLMNATAVSVTAFSLGSIAADFWNLSTESSGAFNNLCILKKCR